jgi:hypothetical protein
MRVHAADARWLRIPSETSKRKPIAKGMAVVVSPLGARRHPRLQGRLGTVTGRSRQYAQTWMVRFGDGAWAQAIHEDYIQPVADTHGRHVLEESADVPSAVRKD